MKRGIAAVSFMITALMLLLQPIGAAGSQSGKVLGYASSMGIYDLLAGSNAQRAAAGEGALNLNGALDAAAQAKANDMVAENYWSHYSPSGASPWTFIINAGYSYSAAGENLAYGFDSASAVISAWMNSPEHRANLLNAGYVDVGFGVAQSANYVDSGPETIVVAEYGTPLGGSSYTAPAPAPADPTPVASDLTPTTTDSAPPPTDNSIPVNTTPVPAPPTPASTPAPTPSSSGKSADTHHKKKHNAVPVATTQNNQPTRPSWLADLAKASPFSNFKNTGYSPSRTTVLALGLTAAAMLLVYTGRLTLPSRLR